MKQYSLFDFHNSREARQHRRFVDSRMKELKQKEKLERLKRRVYIRPAY